VQRLKPRHAVSTVDGVASQPCEPASNNGTFPTATVQRPSLEPLLLTAREAARSLAISERKLWELTKRKLIPCVRIGRAVRYSPLDLQAWIEAQKSNPPTSTTGPQL
jgi:excisionase family DNA binding protein